MPIQVFSIPMMDFKVIRHENGTLSWEGRYQGMSVRAAIPLSQDTYAILLDYAEDPRPTFENLLAVRSDGRVVWKAELPGSHDAFVEVHLVANGLSAATWSGYRVLIDPRTGRIVEKDFVK